MIEKKSNIDEVIRLIDVEIAKRGWKRRRLAQALNKTDAWISKIMSQDIGLSVEIILEIAEKLEINPSSLLPNIYHKSPSITLDDYIRNIVKDEINKSKKGE